jgi:hypothetical protein
MNTRSQGQATDGQLATEAGMRNRFEQAFVFRGFYAASLFVTDLGFCVTDTCPQLSHCPGMEK